MILRTLIGFLHFQIFCAQVHFPSRTGEDWLLPTRKPLPSFLPKPQPVLKLQEKLICGEIKTKYQYNREKYNAYDEYPWMGRVSYTDPEGAKAFRCLGVLFSKRHVITPAHCVLGSTNLSAYSVVLGDWNATNEITERDCNAAGVCAPLPEEYELEEVAVHPDYDPKLLDNDIAVLKVIKDVRFTDYVQPICLLPDKQPSDFIAQRLECVGFPAKSLFSTAQKVRQKAVVYTASKLHCNNVYKGRINVTDNQICGYINSEMNFMSGTALMSIDVVNGIPKNMFLVGIAAIGSREKNYDFPDLFMRIYPYKDWILENSV